MNREASSSELARSSCSPASLLAIPFLFRNVLPNGNLLHARATPPGSLVPPLYDPRTTKQAPHLRSLVVLLERRVRHRSRRYVLRGFEVGADSRTSEISGRIEN